MSAPYGEEVTGALRKLEVARLQERAPQACVECSKSHRKCEYKKRQSRCDKCESKDLRCTFSQRQPPASRGNYTDIDVSGLGASQTPHSTGITPTRQSEDFSTRSPGSEQRHSSDSHSSGSSMDSPIHAHSSRNYPSGAVPFQQNDIYHYNAGPAGVPVELRTQDGFLGPADSYVPSQNETSLYSIDGGHAGRQVAGSSMRHDVQRIPHTQVQGRRSAHYEAMHSHPQQSFVPDADPWNELGTRSNRSHQHLGSVPPSAGRTYQAPAMYPVTGQSPAARDLSIPAGSLVYPGTGQLHVSPVQTYPTHFPASEGYPSAGQNMYQVPQPQNVPDSHYSASNGQVYDYNQASSGSASVGRYGQQHMHQ